MSAQIMVQALDENNDPIEGANGPVFLSDIDAVAQIIATTLKLLKGEWWEDLSIGFPLFQNLIGSSGSQNSQSQIVLVIQQTIQNAAPPFVVKVTDISLIGKSALRQTVFTATVLTTFGTIEVTNSPGISAQVSS